MAARRIALVSSSFAPYVGGVEEHTRHVAVELIRRGYEVEVWTVDRGEHLVAGEVDGIHVRYLPCPQPAMRAGSLWHFLTAFPAAARSWRRAWGTFRPDVLHVQCFGPNGLYALGLQRLTGVPLVVSSHGESFADDFDVFGTSRLMRTALRSATQRATVVTGCSQYVLDDLVRRFGLRGGTVVPNGVVLSGDVAPPPPPAGPRTIAAVGRFTRMKGFDLLLDAFNRSSFAESARLVLGGDGPERSRLREWANELGLDERVAFPGWLTADQVRELFAAASVVVVPSRQEAFGITILEAWRAGRPVIATTRGGPAEFVSDGVDGFLVDPCDAEAFSRCLQEALADPAAVASGGRAGWQSVQAFTWGHVVNSYEEIYGHALRRAGGRR